MNNHKLAGRIYAQLITAAIQAGELDVIGGFDGFILSDLAESSLVAEAIFYGKVTAVEKEGKEP